MTKFIKAKLKKWDDQTKIDKYRVAAKISYSRWQNHKERPNRTTNNRAMAETAKGPVREWVGEQGNKSVTSMYWLERSWHSNN